ncbi:MAG: glycosyltransferase family 2 protein [Myxococcota bacterium]
MFREQRIFVVIPAFNESAHISAVVRGIPSWIDQVIVVDDGSTDRTAELARSSERSVIVIQHSQNEGVGAAITAGYFRALEEGAEVVAVMAGDGQMSPSELASLVGPVVDGVADYVKGDRTTHPLVAVRMPSWRRLGNAALSRWTGLLTGYSVRDAQCGFTVIGANTLRRLPLTSLTRGYGYPNTMLLMLAATGARVREVTVTPIYRGEHSGLTPMRALRTHGALMARATLTALRNRRTRGPGFEPTETTVAP